MKERKKGKVDFFFHHQVAKEILEDSFRKTEK